MIRTRLDSRGWNAAYMTLDCRDGIHRGCQACTCPCHGNARVGLQEARDRVNRHDAEDRRLTVAFWAVCVGFLAWGIIGLLCGTPIGGIG